MIAYLKGLVEHITDQTVLLDVQGMGYVIHTSTETISRLPGRGELAKLYTHLQFKDDRFLLYGFVSPEELHIFGLLTGITGIGAKSAIAILGTLSPEQIMLAVLGEDAAAFSKAPGVGRKTAQRIILELQDKIKTNDLAVANTKASTATANIDGAEKQDAIDALMALGYDRSLAVRAVLAVAEPDMTAQQIIRLSLKEMTK